MTLTAATEVAHAPLSAMRRWARHPYAHAVVGGVLIAVALSWLIREKSGWSVADAVISFTCIGWLYWLTGRQQMALSRFEKQAACINNHAAHIKDIHGDVGALADWLGVDIHPTDVDDSPGHEAELFDKEEQDATTGPISQVNPEEQPTGPIPVQKPTPRPRPEPPPTEPSKAIIVGGARLPAPDDAKTFAAEWVENELVKIRARMAEVGPREHRDEPMEEKSA